MVSLFFNIILQNAFIFHEIPRWKIICFSHNLHLPVFSSIFINIPKPLFTSHSLTRSLFALAQKYANLKTSKFLTLTHSFCRATWKTRKQAVKLTGKKFLNVIRFWFFNWYRRRCWDFEKRKWGLLREEILCR